MRKAACIILILILTTLVFSFEQESESNTVEHTISYFNKQSEIFAATAKELQQSAKAISSDSTTIIAAKQKLAECRKAYKTIEFFAAYFLDYRVNIFNLPPVFEVEEPFMEYQWPVGLQVVEALLFDNPVAQKKEILTNLEIVVTTAQGLPYYLHERKITEAEVLESIRLELIRVTTLGISGFDAPLLKTGVEEALSSLQSVEYNIQPWLRKSSKSLADSLTHYLQQSIELLRRAPNFDHFDRLHFLTRGMLPLQTWLGKLIETQHLVINTTPVLNYKAPHILSREAISVAGFQKNETLHSPQMIRLGKKLFSEPILSGNNSRSCITCHSPEKYFTDGLQKSIAFDGHNTVKRNAPSLFYAAYQYGFFLDGRAPSLEEQVMMVLSNPSEMNADFSKAILLLKKKKAYRKLFKQAYPRAHPDSLITPQQIASAIAAYETSFPVMNAAFDRYIAGDTTALSAAQVKGFNLFMGKALCGTCHFMPLFNGLLPPSYNVMELESLGMITNNNFQQPVADTDSGRFHFFPIQYYTGVFKTPTVRNASKTAPYMHNGSMPTLADVLQFYNQGGGKGLGLDMPYQTLSEKPLLLTDDEMNNIALFMEALTDENPE
ncbi:MAG: cytochrome-c peroxidase [Agriterribacter sp.]